MATNPMAKTAVDQGVDKRIKKNIARRVVLLTGGLAVALTAGMGGYRYYRAKAPLRDVLPTFTDPAPGPRAPASRAFGLALGHSSFDEASALARSMGLDCADTSIRALMRKAREDKRSEVAAAAAGGGPPDAVSGASAINRRSPKEANPQVRWSCEGASAGAIAAMERDSQRTRMSGQGRLLMVFDSPAHPLRHVSFERSFKPAAADAALSEFMRARRSAEARFGPPSKCSHAKSDEPKELAWLSPVECEWMFADLRIRATAIHYGARGIVVGETVEVPWPVRADAPMLPLKGGSNRLRAPFPEIASERAPGL